MRKVILMRDESSKHASPRPRREYGDKSLIAPGAKDVDLPLSQPYRLNIITSPTALHWREGIYEAASIGFLDAQLAWQRHKPFGRPPSSTPVQSQKPIPWLFSTSEETSRSRLSCANKTSNKRVMTKEKSQILDLGHSRTVP